MNADPDGSAATDRLTKDGLVIGALRVPDTARDIEVVADLRARQPQVIVAVAAPHDKGHRSPASAGC